MASTTLRTLVRHEGEVLRERSTCGWRDRLISREDTGVAAWGACHGHRRYSGALPQTLGRIITPARK